MIYFIQSGNSGPIKIGYVASKKRLQNRLKELQTGNSNKLNIINTTSGNLSVEQALHKKFQIERLSGEWFSPSQSLLNFLEQIPVPGKFLDYDKIVDEINQLTEVGLECIADLKKKPFRKIIEEIEKKYIALTLEYTNNNKYKAAELLQISRSTLYAKMKEFEI